MVSPDLCMCCGNKLINRGVGIINSYWLMGAEYVYLVCPECWYNPYLKALFLNQQGDLPEHLIKKFGLSLGYTKQEIKNIQ